MSKSKAAKPAKEEVEVTEKKYGVYRSTLEVKAKIFEQGDEDGIMHVGGLDVSLAKDDSEKIPYIEVAGDRKCMQFGNGYIVEFSDGRRELVETEWFKKSFSEK
jgi:hypothetical protein